MVRRSPPARSLPPPDAASAAPISRSVSMRPSVMSARPLDHVLAAGGRCPATAPSAAAARLRRVMPMIGRFSRSAHSRMNDRGQIRDVLAPLAQRHQVELQDAEAVIEIAAETAGRRLDGEVAVGRGNHADVGLSRLERADALDFAVLDRAQQLGLQRQRQLADLVEKQRAVVGVLEQADLGVGGAGERAAHVAEQLALEQRLDDGGAVDGDRAADRVAGPAGAAPWRRAPCRSPSRR